MTKQRAISNVMWGVVLAALLVVAWHFAPSGTAQAVGDLTIDWGVPTGDPIFVVTDLMPGQVEERDVLITNNASNPLPVGVRGAKTLEVNGLSDALEITISDLNGDLYGGSTGVKTLSDFFTDSVDPDGIPLLTLGSGDSETLTFRVEFADTMDNDLQGDSVTFDITLGVSVEIPEECQAIEFSNDPIFGTEGGDSLQGTSGNDIIFGLGGGDSIRGRGGDDCLVGGEGGDSLKGENGKDVLLGQAGSDSLDGANGEDILVGGDGSDSLKGGNGDDDLFGGEGSDSLRGENGADFADGGGGSDSLRGGSGNDELLGGPGVDSARGEAGTDICEAESENTCEMNP